MGAVSRLYVMTPPLAPASGSVTEYAHALAEALRDTDVAAVLLRLADAGERDLLGAAEQVVRAVQDAGTALLIDGRADIAVRGRADGAHLASLACLKAALPLLKPGLIMGAGGLFGRHDAMLAAEAGADYVMFGEPDDGGWRPALAAIIERVSWWAKLFEIPCVAYAASVDEIGALAAAGADFVALGGAFVDDPRTLRAALAGAAAQLAITEAAI
jgi:thiamine-phosphate pyrophosphorylase